MQNDDTAVRASLFLGAVVLLLCWPPGPPESRACHQPRERAATEGWTSDVGCGVAARSPATSLRGPARLLFGQRLDLNHADAGALETLPGIGPRRALAILATRSRRPFRDTKDLVRVKGIGPRTLERLEPWIRVGGELD
jgi:hypothetical protein